MKHQNSTSNTQRSIKRQASGSDRKIIETVYPEPRTSAYVFNEDSDGKNNGRHPFDLEEGTAKFGEEIVRFSKKIPREPSNDRLIDQVVGAGTIVGANYAEATESISKKDFRCSICRCVKEAKETKFFLRMIRSLGTRVGGKSKRALPRRQRITYDFCEHLPKGKMK